MVGNQTLNSFYVFQASFEYNELTRARGFRLILKPMNSFPFFHQIRGFRSIIFRSNSFGRLNFLQQNYGIKISYEADIPLLSFGAQSTSEASIVASSQQNVNTTGSQIPQILGRPNSCIFFSVLSINSNGSPLNFSFSNRSQKDYLHSVGITFRNIINQFYGGFLVLLPSEALLEEFSNILDKFANK